jgi:flagellar protein FlgJ
VGEAAQQFEALLLNMMLKSMRQAGGQDGMLDTEQSKLYTSMFDQQIAQHLAKRGIGLAEVMKRQLAGQGASAGREIASAGREIASAGTSTPDASPSALDPRASTLDAASARSTQELRGNASAALRVTGGRIPENGAPALPLDAPRHSTRDTRSSTLDPRHSTLDTRSSPLDPSRATATGAGTLQPLETRGIANRIWLRAMEAARTAAPQAGAGTPPAPATREPAAGNSPLPISKTRDFVDRVWSHAVEAARATGIQARFMVGQAALESGWGRHEIRAADGSQTYNIFGVKAGRSWTGPVVEKTTTEYVNGEPQKVTAKFRVYSSYAESFKDYASLLMGNRRYAAVIGQGQDAEGFARGLQQAGYATDPAYADKLTRIINSPTLRASLLG